ncbi:MAG: hypothetical protein KUG79_05705 [Pseudomonadales bacterium]|nr:hypothetical protein [Pseudomonadales bacterium]
MRKPLITLLILGLSLSTFSAVAAPGVSNNSGTKLSVDKDWSVYSTIDLFAYSEPVSVDQFASDFEGSLKDGETAFTHNVFSTGIRWRNFTLGYVHRFDYVTEFTEDTAFIHHSEKNNNPIPGDRDYDVLLDVERLEASGIRLGYHYQIKPGLTISSNFSYYNELSGLQSGKAGVNGDLTPFDAQFKAALETATADLEILVEQFNAGGRDFPSLDGVIGQLRTSVEQVNASLLIDYAYDDPKFSEDEYRQPTINGPANPVISGVSFEEPDGTGYSLDIGIDWQVNDRLKLNLQLIDIINRFNWDDAPQTVVNFNLNPLLLDALDLIQDISAGERVQVNQLIDDHLSVSIINDDYTQKLNWRGDFSASYSLNRTIPLYRWQPNVSVIGGVYHTDTQDFPRIGFSLNDNFKLEYDFGGDAIIVSLVGKYGFIQLISDSFDLEEAYDFGITMGINYQF